MEKWSFDDVDHHVQQLHRCATVPVPIFPPQQMISSPQPMLVTPGLWAAQSDRILEAEFNIMQQRCISMICETLGETRSRISSRLHDSPAMPFVGHPGQFAMQIYDPPNPNAFSKPPVFDDFSPQALDELIGGYDRGPLTNYSKDFHRDYVKDAQQSASWNFGSCDIKSSGLTKRSNTNSQRHQTIDEKPSRHSGASSASCSRHMSHHKKQEACRKASVKVAQALSDGEPDIMSVMRASSSIASLNISFEGGVRATLHRLLHSTKWDLFIACVIVTNAIFMGYQIDWATTHVNEPMPTEQRIIDYLYTFIFTVEVILRIMHETCHFFSFTNKMIHWNCFDCIILASSLVEVYFTSLVSQIQEGGDEGGGINARQIRIFRVIRILRLMKIFRIARLLHFIRALRTLVFSLLHTLKSVFWALLLMLVFIYVFAMILTQAVGEYKEMNACADAPDLCEHWGGLSVSMLSLFKAIAAGISWHEIFVPLQRNLDPTWVVVFLFYVVFLYFAVLNVITGVFCENAIQSAKADQEVVMHEALESKRKYKEKLERLFMEIDQDGSNEIALNELEEYMTSEMSGAFFEYLELEVTDASDIIKLIDVDGSGELTLDEFIDGVCRLRGPAKAVDVAGVIYDNKAFQDWVFKAFEDMTKMLTQLVRVDVVQECGHK